MLGDEQRASDFPEADRTARVATLVDTIIMTVNWCNFEIHIPPFRNNRTLVKINL